MAEESEARVYGMADPANRHPPAAQGMRGERATHGSDDGYQHSVMLGDGREVAVSEDSGVAFAEATGRVKRADRPPSEPMPQTASAPPAHLPLLLSLAGAAIVIGVTMWRLRSAAPHQEQASDDLPLAGV